MIKRINIVPAVWKTVTQSQVFNWIKIISEYGITTDCISLTGNKLGEKEVEEIENQINGRFYQRSVYPILLNDIYMVFVLISFYFKNIKKADKLIFQTRITKIGNAFQVVKIFPRSIMIYEARGAAMEENIFVKKGKQTAKTRFTSYWLAECEKRLIRNSDAVICVSNALKDYFIKKYNIINEEKFKVFPGAADNSLFFYDPVVREIYRKKLGFAPDETVIVYSGKLSMKWEIPDIVFAVLAKIARQESKIKFLILTPDHEIANEHILKNGIETKTIVAESNFNEVNNYLNASDVGLLLRENILMNNVASPTKFSEYLLAGLPVLVSEGILDFAQIVSKTNFGFVLKEDFSLSAHDIENILKLKNISREQVSDWGVKNLSKEKFVSEYVNMLKEI